MQHLFIVVGFSILNRARGSRFWDRFGSTAFSRALAAFLMAAISFQGFLASVWLWLSLWAAFTPRWDEYWSAELGDRPHPKLWGLALMAARMSLFSIPLAGFTYLTDGVYWPSLLTPIMAVPYLLAGVFAKDNPIEPAEYTNGAILGVLVWLIIR